MKKKSRVEADLDPQGTRHTRPGSKIADVALRNAGRAKKRGAGGSRSKPAGGAAAKRKRARRRGG